jgi:hypothetical protein
MLPVFYLPAPRFTEFHMLFQSGNGMFPASAGEAVAFRLAKITLQFSSKPFMCLQAQFLRVEHKGVNNFPRVWKMT